MAERKAQNRYYPPDFDPLKHKNLSQYNAKRKAKNKSDEINPKITKIRFEMPYNIFCLTCKKPIGMGVRYNAEKQQTGMFHSTPIFKFSFRCAMCAGDIVMQTDPENFDYVILEGGRRKDQTWDATDNEQIAIPSTEELKNRALNPMYLINHKVEDKIKGDSLKPVIEEIEIGNLKYQDDFGLNQLARKQFRESKKAFLKKEADDKDMLKKLSLTGSQMVLLEETKEDINQSKLIAITSSIQKRDKIPIQSLKNKILLEETLKRQQDNHQSSLISKVIRPGSLKEKFLPQLENALVAYATSSEDSN